MRLPEIALKNHQLVLILLMMGTFLGLSSLFQMPRNEDPNPKFPFYTVTVLYPGTSPEDMEELVVEPLEEVLDQIDDVNELITSIEEGLAVIQVEASYTVDVDELYDEIIREINTVEQDLPDDIYRLDIFQFQPAKMTRIQQIALTAPGASIQEMVVVGEQIEKQLEKIAGVEDAEVVAYPERNINLKLDFQRMAAYQVPLGQVVRQLREQNLNIPGGDFKAGPRSFSLKSSGSFKSLDEIASVVVSSSPNQLVRLRDIAEVSFDQEEWKWLARYNGQPAVFIGVTQKEGQNLVNTSKEINRQLEEFRLPEGMSMHSVFEQAVAVKSRINGFFINLLQGIVLVGVVIFLFLGFRSSLVVMAVIPLSIIMGIALLDITGNALQQISIAALVIGLGLLVDNGIVVIENIRRYLAMGLTPGEAAVKGTSEVGLAIVSSTLTTLLAFAPLALMQSGPGEFLRSLPLTVIFVLIISLLLALTFTPMVSGKVFKPVRGPGETALVRQLKRIMQRAYLPVLFKGLRKGWLFMAIAAALLLGSIALFPSIGVSFFPTADKPILLIEINGPQGSSLEQTRQAVTYVENVLDSMSYVRDYSSNIGHGNPTIYYNRIGESYKKYHGQVLVNFKTWDPAAFYTTLHQLRQVFTPYHQAQITFSELKNGPPVEAPIEIRIIGENLDTLRAIAAKTEALISNMEGIINMENPLSRFKTDVQVAINRDKAAMAGISLAEIDQAVRTGVDGLTVDQVSFGQEEYDLVLQAGWKTESLPELSKLYLFNDLGDQVPLHQVAGLEFESGVSEIMHFNTERSTSITANLVNADQVIPVTEAIIAALEKWQLPEGYRFHIGGEFESQQESFGDLGTLLLLALLGIFAVLVWQFRSFSQPLIVFAAIPFAITGSFVALFLTGWSFSFFAFVGFISLVGIVVNNSIILVDYTNQLIRSGIPKMQAIVRATQTRFIPIVLTTLTTILGLVPLTFSASNLWSPLGWTIIGGMISSTFLTLLLVPVLYHWFTPGTSSHT